ncbi:hypothetical protein [Phaeovulum sp.]|uniref:hypothetical protein n=1 Tax=Phaeovulum sp. TaxID=2934796 RepID=UPI0039E58D51
MKVLDRHDPFFAAPWRRWLTVLAPGVWAVFELMTGSPGWALMFAAISTYAAWELFLRR